MKFLYPEFLFGLFTLAIPIIIHLFNFRRSKKIYFSSTRFLKNIKKSTSQKLKLKHYLILFSRLLFLTFLVLAFAQPYLPSEDQNVQAESVYIYLDNSSSMSNRVDGTLSSLDLGTEYVQKILELYPTNTSYRFLTNDFAPFSNALKSRDEVEDYMTELKLSYISRTFEESYTRLKSSFAWQDQQGTDLFIISDFQRSTLGDLENAPIDSLDQLFIAPIQLDQTKNIFIDSIYLTNPFLVADEKNQLNVIMKNTGMEDADEVPIKLFINEIQSASSIISIQAGGTEQLNFEIGFNLENINRCRISFEDYPVTFDNDFYFVLKLENKINVMEIRNDDSDSPIEQVYGNVTLFNYASQSASNIDYSLIRRYDLVIVNGLAAIDNSLALELNNFVSQGGSLMIIPSESPDIGTYSDLLSSLVLVQDTSRVQIAMPDLDDPFYENIFESTNDRIEMPDALPVIGWRGQQMELLRLRNDLSFLSGYRKEGTVFTLATPLDDSYTNFHRHALFVPVMYRIASMSKRAFEKPYYNINEPVINLKIDSLNKQDIFALHNESSELIPNQRISANELVLELPKNTLKPGYYELRLGEYPKAVLSFNLDKAESYLEQLPLSEVSTFFSTFRNVTIFDSNDADSFSNEVKKNKFGVPLWKYAIIMSLVFLLAEVLLIRFL